MQSGPNAIGRMLGVLGDEWTLLLVQQSLLGRRRYTEFRQALPISDAVLSARLALLEREGMLERRVYQQRPVRAAYEPTEKLLTLWALLLTIWAWERDWAGPPDHLSRTLPRMVHRDCDQEFTPQLACAACDRPLSLRDLAVEWGPSGSWPRSVPEGTTRRRAVHRGPERPGPGLFPGTMAIFGNRWSSALIAAAFLGLCRFSEFEQALSAPPTVVADRVRQFVQAGILEPAEPDAGYRLTDKGLAFYPVVAHAVAWGERWYAAPEGPALLQTHRPCGASYSPRLHCDRCGATLRPEAVRPVDEGS